MSDLLRELRWLYMLLFMAAAWVSFIERPTASRLKRAIGSTLGL